MLLEKYVEGFDENRFIAEYMKEKKISKHEAISQLRALIRPESYYQTKVMEEIRRKFPKAAIWKNAQGNYSRGGIPDLTVIIGGKYYGFEVKRPIFGAPSRLQVDAIRMIRDAGGVAAVVRWPEEAIAVIRENRAQK